MGGGGWGGGLTHGVDTLFDDCLQFEIQYTCVHEYMYCTVHNV